MEHSFKIKEHFSYALNGALQTIATTERHICLLCEDSTDQNDLYQKLKDRYHKSYSLLVLDCFFSEDEREENRNYSSEELDQLCKPKIMMSASNVGDKALEDHIKEANTIFMSPFGLYDESFFIQAEQRTRSACGGRRIFSGKRVIMFDSMQSVLREHEQGRIKSSVFKSQLFHKLNPIIIKVR